MTSDLNGRASLQQLSRASDRSPCDAALISLPFPPHSFPGLLLGVGRFVDKIKPLIPESHTSTASAPSKLDQRTKVRPAIENGGQPLRVIETVGGAFTKSLWSEFPLGIAIDKSRRVHSKIGLPRSICWHWNTRCTPNTYTCAS